jgi:tetratricopeptide (TPR) repeat protein/mono/diheme cytochrome c family protein
MRPLVLAVGLVAASSIPTTVAAVPPAETPTFSRDIAPIVFRHCATCHNPGSNAAFSLLTYEDVRPRARSIAAVTRNRYMPPWKPEPGYSDEFLARRGLTENEIATIERWSEAGAPQGDRTELPPTPKWTDAWRLGTPDLVIRMPEPYQIPAAGPDVFRLFVLPIPTDAVRYVRAIEFLPGTRAVHHANMRLDETRTSRALDERDPAPGYDGLLARTAQYPEGYFFGWTPGQLPPASEDLAWRLNPGTDMVLQLHLRPTGKPERVQAAIGLYFATRAPRFSPAMLRLGKQNIDIAPGERDYVVTDSYLLPVDVDVHAVQPHAHYRAREVSGTATLPDGTKKWLLLIRDWDFDWQDTYRYARPFTLPKGTTLQMRYTYDNSAANRRNPQLPPQRVHWGQNSSDEMGDLWIQVVPRSRSDLDLLVRDFRQKVFREDILGYESVLQRTPDDVGLHDDLALLYLEVGRVDDAIAQFSESRRITPDKAAVHFNLGTALTTAGRIDEAIVCFRRALQLEPEYVPAHNNLGSLLVAGGHLQEAAVHFRSVLEIEPVNPQALNNLGSVLIRLDRSDEALTFLRRALKLDPNYADAEYNVAHALVSERHPRDAIAHYQRALTLRPDWPPVLSELAWLLAVNSDASLRNPGQAVAFAERAVALTRNRDPRTLDVLAAASAAVGRFDQAVTAAQAAIDLLNARGARAGVAAVTDRLALYERRQPYVDAGASGPVLSGP